MLEKYAAQVLNHYIGKYVQNFNPANLSIGLLQGDVELEDLLLRQDALKELELPGIELVWGCIGKISLNIPSYKNYSEPWVIEIHNLNLVLSPCKHSDVLDELTENQQQIDSKYKQLTAREEKWHATYGFNRSIYGIWQAYSSSIVTKILQNLQVRVYKVHIRYEDETTCSTSFAFGLHVDSLLIQSTDENWQPNPTNLNSADKKWKLVHLSNMSMYWDTNARFFGHDMHEIKDLMMNYKADLVEPDASYASKYIVNPVNSEAKFIQDLSSWPLRSDLNPRLSFTMDLQLVALQLSKSQYNQMLALGEEITRWNLQHSNRVGRPTNTITKNPRTWWRWAIMKHLSTIKKMRERRKKEFICRRVKLILCYVENYQKLLNIKYVLKTQNNEVSDIVCQVEEELSLNELLILREIVYEKLDRIRIAKKQQEKTKSKRGLSKTKKPDSRGWGWHGWFGNWGQTNEGLIEIDDKTESTQPVHDQQKSVYEELDDRELYEMFGEGFTEKETNDSFLRRDNVLLKLNFNLDKGSITVYDDTAHKCLGVVDLQFNRLQLATQWRPRTSTYTMQVDLGDVVLKDLDKINKHYSNLVKLSDQSRLATTNTQQLNMATENKKSVFSLFYEKLPMLTSNSSSDRLRVTTASLSITCIPGLMERLKKFVSKPDTVTYAHHGSDLLTNAARQKYVAWKQHTQHEISNTVKRIMDGKAATKLKEHRWEIMLDICAPEFILPENISDPNTKLVVFNLGHIKFSSDVTSREDTQVENIVPMVDDSDDDDDDFSTPLNSPPPESTVEMKVPSSSSPPILSSENEKPEELNENIMMEKMYERFHLSFSNLQVMVTQRNMEWWNVAKNRGRHNFHFIEPFTVDLEIQRRVVNTNDPLYPALKVAGKLPHLTLHISDMKVRTIKWCFNQFISKPDKPTKQTSQQTSKGNLPTTNLSPHEMEHALSEQLQCDFKINQVSIILEKDLDNQFIAVLQINRVQTIFSRRPFDASAELSIYSLLLVDVMQQLGKDFELLLASHRNVYLDVDSGQILDSGATSPDHAYSATYPVKQNVARCASEPYNTTTTHVLTKAAQNLEKSVEYLIQVQLQMLKHGSPHKEGNNANEVTIVNAKFNNLDAVFNVSSWTKLLSFLHNLFPQREDSHRRKKSRLSDERKLKSTAGTTQLNSNNDSSEIHVNFDFKKLNLLLLRHVHTRDKIIGRKVATVTLQTAKFVGNIENERRENGERQSSVVVNGSVESLQVQDLTLVEQGTWKTQGLEIFNIGDTCSMLDQFDDPSTQKAFLFNFITGKMNEQTTLTETVTSQSEQRLPHNNEDVITHSSLQFPVEMKREELQQQAGKIESKLEFEVALFCYIHCPRFVAEILALVDEVNNVTDKMMTTATRQAYKDMARTIMDKVSDYSRMGKTTVETPSSHPTVNPSTTTEGDKNKFNFLMKLKSPLIALPKYAGSYELLVANLGEITVCNQHEPSSGVGAMDKLRINIVNMNLRTHRQVVASNTSFNICPGANISQLKKLANKSSSVDSNETTDFEILHNTTLQLTVDKIPFVPNKRKQFDVRACCEGGKSTDGVSSCCGVFTACVGEISDKQMKVAIHTSSATTVSLCKSAYEQILKTLDNIAYGEDIDDIADPHTIHLSHSAPDVSTKYKNTFDRRQTLSSASLHPNQPSLNEEFTLFEFPRCEKQQEPLVTPQIRKYTPLHADFTVPCLMFQLDGDLGDGQQGIVKVTIQEFKASYEKENRFATSVDFSLGSLDIEDLLQAESSRNRYIVVSSRQTKQKDNSSTDYISTSCPSVFPHFTSNTFKLSQSLPTLEQPYQEPLIQDEDTPYIEQTCNDKLVRINAFLIDGKSEAYNVVYGRTNRFIDIDFNSLDCKVNLETWVVLLDFFGIGTSPKKTYRIDKETEQTFPTMHQLEVRSFYENQPDVHINSEIDFNVKRFSLMFVKTKYELLRADITNLMLHAQLKDGRMRVNGQLGGLAVSDLSPNGFLFKERFIFTGDKALDFDIIKFDDYDYNLERSFDISVRLRMASIRYVHTQRFQNETIAFCQHFQQLQEVLGRMRAASVGQSVRVAACRQARIALDFETGPAIILIPESSHTHRVVVANLGRIIVKNKFLKNGEVGTLSSARNVSTNDNGHDVSTLFVSNELQQITRSGTFHRACVLDVIHVTLVDMDLYTALHHHEIIKKNDNETLVFPSYTVVLDKRPLLTQKVQLKLQLERNLEKEITHNGVPDTALSAQLSSVDCKLDHNQYWLIRGVLDHNVGEAIPDFPQPTAFLQPSELQTVLTGDVYTQLSLDVTLTNVSIELLKRHATSTEAEQSLGRLDFLKSVLEYRALSNNTKTANLSCEAFRAHDTRWTSTKEKNLSLVTVVLGPTQTTTNKSKDETKTSLQFELFQRSGPNCVEFVAVLNSMRVIVILDWLLDMQHYILDNPDQERFIALKEKTAKLMAKYGQQDSGNQQDLDNSGQLNPVPRNTDMRLSITETEFVMFENLTCVETDAIILRSTAVINYAPDNSSVKNDLPFRCSLERLEIFSCQLNNEKETALSIIDPVTLSIEVRKLKQSDLLPSETLNDRLNSNILDVYVPDLNMRVSFNDVMLILAVFKSLPMQLSNKNEDNQPSTSHDTSTYQYTQASVVKLVELGYSNADVIHALSVHCGDEELSMRWLMEHATLQPTYKSKNKELPLHLSRVCCHIDTSRLCLIDDCGDDCDVPLAEFTIQQLVIKQLLATHMTNKFTDTLFGEIGSASFKLSAEYYNRVLSLWEPFIDPWRCVIEWKHIIANHNMGEWWMKLDTSDRFDLSVTSTLIETIKKTHSTWIQHYVDINNQPATQKLKTRNPFVPYILRNLTGCQLSFVIKSTTSTDNKRASVGTWKVLEPGQQSSFHFALFHEKQRHKRTPLLKEHQIRVKVGEWKELAAVTVSRVGVFFRHAVKEINKSSTVYAIPEPVRVVFSITLVGSAQKVITVRSALVVQSKVKVPVQLQLDGGPNIGVHTLESISPGESQYIPLQLTSSHIRVRPKIKSSQHHFSSTSVTWTPVTKSSPEQSTMLECPAITSQSSFFFSICIQREDFPSDEQIYENLGLNEQEDGFQIIPQLPGHTIIILPTITISNLLPCDLYYYVKNEAVEGTLKPGLDATPHTIAVQQTQSSVILGCLIENFKTCRELVIPSNGKNFQMRMLLKDHNNATLILNVRILWRYGCSVRISVMAGYWIVNKTGLPILVKQDGTNTLAAGQHEAHEEARSLQPLLFSYADRDQPYLCTMRVGKKAQIGGTTHGQQTPWFCEKFSTDGGSCTRNLRMITSDGTPNREFCIGISVRRGWGRYMHTHIVTVAPRFLLFNNTKHNRLSFAQRHTISNPMDPVVNATHLTIIPGSSVVFHWPRVDRDTLLCVRLADEPMVRWSGGFLIDRTDAFHIPLRLQPSTILYQNAVHPLAPHCIFLNIEVTLNNATYTVCVSDADPSMLPPPLRVDNISSAPIIFNQFDTTDTIEVDGESQVAYACDEPCKPQKLQCQVKGSHVQAVIDMNDLDSEKQLYYDNYIYISVGSTKHNEVLVFDVVSDDKQVVLQPLQRGKRSQLWRMKSDGRIFHEGSAPPNKKIYHSSSTSHRENYFVLDISEMAIKDDLGRGIPLSLKRKDERRNSTQTWWFEDHGRLHCLHRNLCVQAKELKPGNLVVLASFPQGRVCLPHELCQRHKHIPGSGVLSLKVVRDGPTRVLRIVDIRQKRAGVLTPHKPDWTILQSHTHNNIKFHTNFSMMKGIGVSLVNNTPEELIYITMNGVTVDMSSLHGEQSITLKMQKVQIDNQLMKCQYPVMLSARQTSSSSTDPLVSIHTVTQASSSRMYGIYKSLNIDVGRLSLQLEEQLLLKLLYFIGYGKISSQQDTELLDETKVVEMNTSSDTTTTHRYYFEAIRLSAMPVQLSVFTASRLSPELKAVKQALNLTLVQFERAPVIIKSYTKHHVFENISFILKDVTKFLRDQMMGQAAMILGSVDFLGNPIGLLSDVKAGVTGLAKGNFQNMIMHFTHGVSNSTAKVTSSLSKGLGGITMDDEYDETRRMIQENAHDAGGHVVAGVQGLMAGVIGGITSVITQPVRGAQKDGAKGFFKGIAKGVIGTVTKPVTGMLDLASESASAVREISVTKEQQTQRVRPTRCCHSFQGCLQSYSFSRAKGQQVLYSVNRHDFSEHFYADSTLSFPSQENVLVMITSKKVYFINGNEPDPDHVWLLVGYDDLVSVQVLPSQSTSSSESAKLELTIKSKHHGIPSHKKPQVTCHSKALAERVCERINFAKSLFNERSETLCYGSSDVGSDRSFDLDV
nr:vacuolar protein sorting-associated protein 13D [Ciona intestinalis]|eukprot:XP_018668116.1 vacuolar protein sorting-associated protein 13D [Ciona intestinalis]